MKINEIILEISNRQRREQKAAQRKAEQERLRSEQAEREQRLAKAEEARREKRRRMMAGQLAQKQREPEPVASMQEEDPFVIFLNKYNKQEEFANFIPRRGLGSKNEQFLKSLGIQQEYKDFLSYLAQQKELEKFIQQQELQQKYEQDDIFGVELFFQVAKNPSGNNGLYVYWTQQTTPQVDRQGTYEYYGTFVVDKSKLPPKKENTNASHNIPHNIHDIGDIPDVFQLIKKLVDKYKQVYILFDQESMQLVPELQELLSRLNEVKRISFKKKLGYDTFSYRENEDGYMEEAIKWDIIPSREEYFRQVYSASQKEKQQK